ncbi:Oidioi.mRNA.OKI2018_I69.XSR.g15636.t1.cds [Oikopleura dioica]|uniref:Oidioi.mRNA.OKI2018_I69.XSR.g15636.t1.cds n=1 Tax=Oikopleura dioica TaxID=34765 RepID=A0ABN7SMP5_OIKDI|nr:Oidioi.mRNA.OKI2018_I69.XSR.g15636.t1.cds [Oikopleura dioica]
MGKKDKKKGKGAEKAQAKALKKASKKEEGLDELEALIKSYQEQDAKENTVAETAMEQAPSQRSHCTFVAHCEKDLLYRNVQ